MGRRRRLAFFMEQLRAAEYRVARKRDQFGIQTPAGRRQAFVPSPARVPRPESLAGKSQFAADSEPA